MRRKETCFTIKGYAWLVVKGDEAAGVEGLARRVKELVALGFHLEGVEVSSSVSDSGDEVAT